MPDSASTTAVAIVVAPTGSPTIGIFRLTDPPGLSIISQCQQGTGFHPHPNVPLYTEADSPDSGHVILLPDRVQVKLIDLR